MNQCETRGAGGVGWGFGGEKVILKRFRGLTIGLEILSVLFLKASEVSRLPPRTGRRLVKGVVKLGRYHPHQFR